MSRPYDVVIFGASGFTGQFVVEHLAKALQREDGQVSWAVSGRSEAKLKQVLENASKSTGLDLSNTPLVLCDVSESSSVLDMAKSAKVVINCVGPYRFYGEQIVSACVEAGTHHVDISGEPQYLEKMQLKYHKEAQEKGVYIVGACGFDSIPSDVGQVFLAKKMGGDVNAIETYLKVLIPENVSGPTINFATYQSAIHGFAHSAELKPLRRQIYPERLPKMNPKLKPRSALHYSDIVDSWCLPFPGSDKSVMVRTQRELYHTDGKRPAQLGCYVQISSLFYAMMTILCGAVFGLFAKTAFGRSLLEMYPGFFSMGKVSKKGPSKEMAENTDFILTLVGQGWSEQSSDGSNPDRQVTVTVSGKNVGYGSTCDCVVQAALVLLAEPEKVASPSVSGGVFTPGYAFKDTSLVDRLNRSGVEFKAVVKDL